MSIDLIVQAYDVALLQSAAHYDLHDQKDRDRSARRLAELFELVVRAVSPRVVLELGARAADFSRRLRPLLPDAAIHAFEANPYNVARFGKVAEAAGVAFHHLALGDEVRDCVFKVAVKRDGQEISKTRGSSSLRVKAQGVEYEDAPVRMVTVDHFVAQHGLAGERAALWIDVEGCAYEVISGARKTLEHTLALMVEVEDRQMWVDQKTSGAVKRLLFEAGFIPVARDFEYKAQHNIVFVKSDIYDHHAVRWALERGLSGTAQEAT